MFRDEFEVLGFGGFSAWFLDPTLRVEDHD